MLPGFSCCRMSRTIEVHDRILFDVGDEARIEYALPIVRGIKAAIEVEIGASQVQPDLFGHLLQRFQPLR